jgi:hypothetical protein
MSESVYRDPSRLFSVIVPEGFERDPRAKSLVFRHKEIDGTVTVSCLRHRVDSGQVNLFDALPSRDGMQNIEKSERDGMNIVYGEYEGELQNQPEYWRWWTMQRGPVGIVVSFNGSPDAADEKRVDELVEGIRITPRPPIGVEDFTKLGAEVFARSLDKPAPQITRPLELNTGGDSVLRLDNAYISYLDAWDEDSGAAPEKHLEQWFEMLWGEQDKDLGPFEEVRGMLYPVVRGWGYGRETKVPVLRRTLVDNELEMLAVLDTGRTLRFIGRGDLDKWEGVSEDDVFFFARENLMALSQDLQLQTLADPDGTPKAVIIATGDSYDASRLVLPTLYEKLAEVIGPNLLVGVPNRDFMIILSEGDTELVDNVAAQVKVDAEQRPYPISGKLFKLTKDGVESR